MRWEQGQLTAGLCPGWALLQLPFVICLFGDHTPRCSGLTSHPVYWGCSWVVHSAARASGLQNTAICPVYFNFYEFSIQSQLACFVLVCCLLFCAVGGRMERAASHMQSPKRPATIPAAAASPRAGDVGGWAWGLDWISVVAARLPGHPRSQRCGRSQSRRGGACRLRGGVYRSRPSAITIWVESAAEWGVACRRMMENTAAGRGLVVKGRGVVSDGRGLVVHGCALPHNEGVACRRIGRDLTISGVKVGL